MWLPSSIARSIPALAAWIRRHIHFLVLGLILAVAAFFRFWAAPLSSGPDINQFQAFAGVFHTYGLDFYKYAGANLDIFPSQGWGFVYPPIWLLLLGLSSLFAPLSPVTEAVVDPTWRIAMKTPIITADLAIGILLFWAVPGSKIRKLFFASLWLFHPTAWFESGVFGQFDAVAAAFLLTSVILLLKQKDRWAFLFAGLAVMTKQHTLIPVILMVIVSSRYMSFRRFLSDCAITAGVIITISVPFLVTGNFYNYARSLFVPMSAPGYQSPIVFAFSGAGNLLTYLHETFGWNISGIFPYTTIVVLIALVITGIISYKKLITPLQATLAGFLIFTSFFYRINYQYLIIYIPLAILLASRTQYWGERIFALAVAMLPAAWIWLTNLPWWFTDKIPRSPWVSKYFSPLGLAHNYLPDYVYMSLVSVIMCISLAYVVLAFTRWRQNTGRLTEDNAKI